MYRCWGARQWDCSYATASCLSGEEEKRMFPSTFTVHNAAQSVSVCVVAPLWDMMAHYLTGFVYLLSKHVHLWLSCCSLWPTGISWSHDRVTHSGCLPVKAFGTCCNLSSAVITLSFIFPAQEFAERKRMISYLPTAECGFITKDHKGTSVAEFTVQLIQWNKREHKFFSGAASLTLAFQLTGWVCFCTVVFWMHNLSD